MPLVLLLRRTEELPRYPHMAEGTLESYTDPASGICTC